MSSDRIFGTDGIRGRAGEGWLSAERVTALGRALGSVLGREDAPRAALIGHDGRRSGPELAGALAAGLAAAGFEAHGAGLIPTPGLAWLTGKREVALGAMISASHNPAADNGIKVFSSEGGKLSDELEMAVEDELRRQVERPAEAPRTPPHDPGLEEAYLAHVLESAGAGLDLSGQVLCLDCANGAGSRVAPRVLGRLGAQLQTLACDPDGDNINLDCGSTHPEALQREVRARGARMGIALDGDGDRCILVDERGEIVHGDGIMTVLARHAARTGRLGAARIVATVMSNRGLHRALREVGVDVLEVGVGDRQVVEAMRREGLSIGGEQSGHIVLGERTGFIGDGLVTALAVLRVLQDTGETLSAAAAPYQPFPQVLLNVPVRSKPSLAELPGVLEDVRAVEAALGQDGRVLLRYSGTEDLARVMVEGPDAAVIQAGARRIADSIVASIGRA